MIFWILFPHLSVMNSASVSGHFKSQHKIHEVFSFLVCAVLNLLYNNQKRINMISFCETYACLGWHYARINFWIALIIVKLSLLKTCDWLQILLFCCFLFCCQKIILFYLLFFLQNNIPNKVDIKVSRDRILEDSYRAIMSLKRTDVLKARYCNRVRAADFEIIAPDGDQNYISRKS